MRHIAALFILALLTSLANAQQLQTVAEKSDYKATSTYADVIAFCEAIAKRGPTAKLDYFGTSYEGRKLPLLVIANPPVASPEEAKKTGKMVVLAFANIHAGEVDGKEALLALARDLTDRQDHPLLKNLVVLLAPIFNADGNERFGPKNRPGQNGPPETGIRSNAQGYDLNRDFVKLESPEVRALVKLFNTWDPAVIIDCHTTNGSKHRHTLTHDGPRYPLADRQLISAVQDRMLPDVGVRVKKATGFDTCPYGNFSQDRKTWETYQASPRYGVQYIGARGRLGILSESYSHAPFRDRVMASHAFVTAVFEHVAENQAEVKKCLQTANALPKRVPVRTETVAQDGGVVVYGFEEEQKDGRRVVTDRPMEYKLRFLARVSPTETVEAPYAYLIPVEFTKAVETLQRHGIKVEELREDVELTVEAFRVEKVDSRTNFQQHKLINEVTGQWKPVKRRIPAGTLLVKSEQPLGTLAVYLLEPRSEDGLTTWNFFDAGLAAGQDFPVLRLVKSAPLTLGTPAPLPEDRVTGKPITEQVLASGILQGAPSANITAWLDGEHFLQIKDGKLWKVTARTGEAEPFTRPELIQKSLAALKEVTTDTARQLSTGTSFRFNPDRSAFLFNIGADLGLAYLDGRPAVRLTKGGGAREHLTFSPDGKRIAFVRGGNLYAIDTERPEEKQLTFDGGDEVLNGKADWVYFEEIFNRNAQAFWWSPDSKQIAFLRFDDTPVRRFNIVGHHEVRGRLEVQPYPKAGDPNPLVRIGIVSATGGSKPQFLSWGEYPIDSIVVSRVGWLPDSKRVFAYVQNRTQTWLDFVVWDDPQADPKALFRETTKAWVDDLGAPHFLPDGSFLVLSERSGWKHLYRYAADGKLLGPVTEGRWQVQNILRVDPKADRVYFAASAGGPAGTHLYGASIVGGKAIYALTSGGNHQVSLAPSGNLFIDRYTDDKTPTQTRLEEIPELGDPPAKPANGNGGIVDPVLVQPQRVRVLDTNPLREREQFKFGRYERAQIKTKDGFELEAAITYPPDFDPKKKYPVWVLTYGGPNAPTIRTGWSGGRGFEQTLATNGIVAFRVDPRSASGKGAESAWTCYKQLGVQELKDLEEAVAWLCKNEWADPTRVGISGHSYGGFMAAFALTHSKVFSAGIAGSAVTDWKLYDSIYTERYMLTPKENPEGYAKTSCVAAAKNLHGKLLITHGMMDDNVHLQNSVQLIDALQRANKDFEMMFYPQARHGTGGPHYTKLQLDFIRRTMGVK